VEVADGALHDPALATKPGAVLGAAQSDHWDDPTSPELPAVLVVVIATVGQYSVGLSAWTPDAARDRRLAPRVDQRQQLRDIVAVAGADRDGQRYALAVGQSVGLDAILCAIRRGRACVRPPKTARWEDPSTTPVVQSIAPWEFSSANKAS
jgi:hypothetical protein